MSVTDTEAETLALLLSQMRSDWNPRGILTLIKRNQDAFDFPALARAAVNAATNQNNRTPAVIFMMGTHWADPNTTTPSQRRMIQGLDAMRGATFKPRHGSGDPDSDRRMNELQADNPEYKPRFVPTPITPELEA